MIVPAFLMYCQTLPGVQAQPPQGGHAVGRQLHDKGRGLAPDDGPAQDAGREQGHDPAAEGDPEQGAAAGRGEEGRGPGAKRPTLAPQPMKEAVRIVAIFSLGLRRVRAAMTPGTAQPPGMPPWKR